MSLELGERQTRRRHHGSGVHPQEDAANRQTASVTQPRGLPAYRSQLLELQGCVSQFLSTPILKN